MLGMGLPGQSGTARSRLPVLGIRLACQAGPVHQASVVERTGVPTEGQGPGPHVQQRC